MLAIRPWQLVALAVLVAAPAGQAPIEHGERLEINGTELYVHRKGEGHGTPIVVVHGGPVLEHGYLLPWLSPLADDREVVFYDQRLSGRSAASTPTESVRVDVFVEDIEALREALGLGRVHLLAHSWGGHLALNYALRFPESLRSLVLLDSMAASTEMWRAEEAALTAARSERDSAELQRLRSEPGVAAGEPEALRALLLASFRLQFRDRARADDLALYVPPDYLARSAAFGAMMPDLTEFDLHPRLGEIEVPTLVLYGADEPGLELGGRAIHEGIADSELVVIDDAGHFPFIERPEEFLERVRTFLDRVDLRDRRP